MRILFAWQRREARRAGHRAAKCAAVLAVQRFGGAMNLNVHGHALVPDGVFVLEGERYVFVPLAPPEEADLLALTARLARRVTALVERRYQSMDEGAGEILDGALGEAMSRPALPFWTQEAQEQDAEAAPRPRRCASVDGFGIHAGTAVSASDRVGLEKLCRYGLRPPFSHERLSLAPDGKVIVGLRKPWPTPSGSCQLVLEPLAFLRRLASLTPPPYAHLIRHYGLFAPGAKGRDLLPPAPPSPLGQRASSALRQSLSVKDRTGPTVPPNHAPDPEPPSAPPAPAFEPQLSPGLPLAEPTSSGPLRRPPRRTLPWHELLRRVFAFDVLLCPKCAGPMTVLAYLTEQSVLDKILRHLGLPTTSPPLSPARRPEQVELFEDDEQPHCGGPVRRGRPPPQGGIRGPPPQEHHSPPCDDQAVTNDWTIDPEMDWGA
jgi:hypothetical protein